MVLDPQSVGDQDEGHISGHDGAVGYALIYGYTKNICLPSSTSTWKTWNILLPKVSETELDCPMGKIQDIPHIFDTLTDDLEAVRQSKHFDADWYLEKYSDVTQLGMDPAEHYLKYGAAMRRDPSRRFCTGFYIDTRPGVTKSGMNPILYDLRRKSNGPLKNNVLWAASNVSRYHGYKRALALAMVSLPKDLQFTTHILRANQAHINGDEGSWLANFNAYLEHYKLRPITLKPQGPSLLSRLSVDNLTYVEQGPLISVIMAAWNAEETVDYAARSILQQTWRPLELLIVDDASTDDTWNRLKELAASDTRVKILRNKRNVGPYVSKNIALMRAQGDYITGHDADDWAHPERLENHIRAATKEGRNLKASLNYMVRIRADGFFGHIGKITGFSLDGATRKASISCLFEEKFLKERLGYWDSVRFGGDSEMISRAKRLLGDDFADLPQIGMICLDLETSLTNHPIHGVDKVLGVSSVRADYRDDWTAWQNDKMTNENSRLDFPQVKPRYRAAPEMTVPYSDIMENLEPT
ncbi:glycosyltransferase family 2 protein [Sulfitobacter aestuarii]|uniref:Glycosyltransferase family 2 protein n=1 Tax=Sulfitobacter aestuarii TaxID=2161676 RepID=A0ABW5U9G4_9RHOB